MSAISDMGINIVESDEDVQEEAEQETDDDIDVSSKAPVRCRTPRSEEEKRSIAQTIPCACTCAKWARSSC